MAEEKTVFFGKQPGAGPPAYGVADVAADYCRADYYGYEFNYAELALGGEKAGGKQQGVSWKNNAKEQSALGEYNKGYKQQAAAADYAVWVKYRHQLQVYQPVV
jgi:hypothetical protein